MKNKLLILYLVLSILNIIASAIDHSVLIYITKPLLMLVLIGYFLKQAHQPTSTFKKIIVAALFFSWLGDTFLMFVENPPFIEWFFLIGLGAFLIAHLCYISAFLKIPSQETSFLKKQPWWIAVFLGFLLLNIYTLWSGIPADMKIPVVIYSCVIVLMAITCLHLKGRIPKEAFLYLFGGVLLFVLSDTCIGIKKFKYFFPFAQATIMILYLSGQLFICQGAIKIHNYINKKGNHDV